MTTVVDPTGTPSVTYNRSGITIIEVAASTNENSPGQMPSSLSGHTVALVSVPGSGVDNYVRLPDDCDVGDVVEAYCAGQGANALFVLLPVGDTVVQSNRADFRVVTDGSVVLMKVAPTKWVARPMVSF